MVPHSEDDPSPRLGSIGQRLPIELLILLAGSYTTELSPINRYFTLSIS